MKTLIHIEQAIIVEGKYDKIRLKSFINGVILPTNGFGIFRDKEKCALIRHYAKTTGIIILTDSDTAGFKIRSYIKGFVSDGKIVNAYIPDVFGKEKRKLKPSKEEKLGVEGLSADIITDSLKKAGVLFSQNERTESISKMDLYEDGFIGLNNSSSRRKMLLKRLGLPELLTTASMLEVLNSMLDKDEYRKIADEVISEALVESE
ncbi:MAG: DUF4093 domain-containing protein [Oscillospiraceae bacterium]